MYSLLLKFLFLYSGTFFQAKLSCVHKCCPYLSAVQWVMRSIDSEEQILVYLTQKASSHLCCEWFGDLYFPIENNTPEFVTAF